MAVHQVKRRANFKPTLVHNVDDTRRKVAHAVFSKPEGKEMLDILDAYTYGNPSFNFKSENCALEAAFAAGMRETVEFIHMLLKEQDYG